MSTSKLYFDQVATQWDTIRAGFYSEAVRDAALVAAAVQPGKLAADIGAGTGFITAGLVAADVRVIAVDQSEAMRAEMKRRFAGVGEVDYRLGEASRCRSTTGSATTLLPICICTTPSVPRRRSARWRAS
jgi:ubiquinone/menaquinone biosynthesis C-methylase UbiE